MAERPKVITPPAPDYRPQRGSPPIPPERPVQPHGYVPPEPPARVPTPPEPKKADDKKPDGDFWSFSYSGVSSAEGVAVAFTPIELSKPKPITIQFDQDDQFPVGDPLVTPQPPFSFDWPFAAEDFVEDTEPTAGHLSLDAASLAAPHTATKIYVSIETTDPALGFTPAIQAPYGAFLELRWTFGGAFSWARWAINDITPMSGSPGWIVIEVTPAARPGGFVPGSGVLTPIVTNTPELVTQLELWFIGPDRPDLVIWPNAAVRARVTYSAGKAEAVPIECDWTGALQVVGSRVLIERKTVRADPLNEFHTAAIKIAAVASLNGPRAPILPRLTEPPASVPGNETRILPLPRCARRVSLLATYGDEGASGDAPLGQLFVAFIPAVDARGGAIAYIDAMSAREALFGDGLPIPAGTKAVALTNRSDDESVRLGLIWHLGI